VSGVLIRLVDHLTGSDGRHEAPVSLEGAEPVLDEAEQRAKAGVAIASVVGLAVTAGVLGPGDAPLWIGVLTALAAVGIAVLQAVLTIRRAYLVRAQVTPWPGPVVPGDVVDQVDVPDEADAPGPDLP